MAKIQSDRCEVAQFDGSGKVRLVPMNDVLGPQLSEIQRTIDEIEQGKDAPPSDFDLVNLFPMVWRTTSKSGAKLAFIGTIHGEHRTSQLFSVDVLRRLITAIRPDYVLTEIPPNRLSHPSHAHQPIALPWEDAPGY